MKTKLLSTVAPTVVAAMLVNSTLAFAGGYTNPNNLPTATPIKHIVVIFNENRSFDHYFATYPVAANPAGEIPFVAKPHTPAAANLKTAGLLTNNPNLNPANGTGATNPFRLDRTQANTASQNHAYRPEQEAYDNGKMDLFPKFTGRGTAGGVGAFGTSGQVMGYFDGNTVTALWNYAQNFAMNDNHYTDSYGPSTPGALAVVAGQNNGAVNVLGTTSTIPDGQGGLTLINDTDPAYDKCSSQTSTLMTTGKNIGDAQCCGDQLGRLHGRLRPDPHQHQRHDGLQALDLFERHRRHHDGLHPASQLVPILPVDLQPDPRTAELVAGGRPHASAERRDP